MQSASDYLRQTESAVRVLFSGVESYIEPLRRAAGTLFMSGETDQTKRDAQFAAWRIANADQLKAAQEDRKQFIAESFALGTLCGAILQVAEKALELYGSNKTIPSGLPATLKPYHAKFCVGRTIRTLPLGLIVYAARNQHTHFNEDELKAPSKSVFDVLATAHGYCAGQGIVDTTFDLNNPNLLSFASNVTALIKWRSYDAYLSDMRSMLGVEPSDTPLMP